MRAPRRTRMRPEFGFTREGRVFVLVTLGIGIGAVNTGNNLLYMVLGLLLGLLLTSGVLSEIALRGIRITHGRPPRAFAGTPCLFELEVTNEKTRFASLSFEVGDRVEGDDRETRAYLQELGPRERTTVVVERTPKRRGPLAFTHVRVRTRFPFGLLEKSRVFDARGESLVFPALVPVPTTAHAHHDPGSDEVRNLTGSGPEVLGVRDHREGDPARDIHWRRTASLGRVVVRERSRERTRERSVSLRCERSVDEPKERFESDVSLAASLVVDAIERGESARVRTEDGTLGVATDRGDLDRLLASLARIEPRLVDTSRPPP